MRKLLIVVDEQRDFVSGALGFAGAQAIQPAIVDKLEQARREGTDIVFTLDTHAQDYAQTQEGRKLPLAHCIKGSPGWELVEEVAPYCTADTPRFEKGTFGSLALAQYLARQSYDQIELVGLVSNICVLSNAVLAKAALPEAEIVVDARCTACADASMQEKALDVMEGLQIRVTGR